MTIAASTQGQTFEKAETLAQGVAEWLCALGQPRDRVFAACLTGGLSLAKVAVPPEQAAPKPSEVCA
jgi:hypothetical protein